jgi:hypothetical protein
MSASRRRASPAYAWRRPQSTPHATSCAQRGAHEIARRHRGPVDAELHEGDRLAEAGEPAGRRRVQARADARAAGELDGDDGQQQRMAPPPLEHAVEHQAVGVVEARGLDCEVVAQRVRHAGGLPVGMQLREPEEVTAVLVEALERAPLVDRPELCRERQQQRVELRAAPPRDVEERARLSEGGERAACA